MGQYVRPKFSVCLFPTVFYHLFSKQIRICSLKLCIYWWETDKLKIILKKMKSLNLLDAFSFPGCTFWSTRWWWGKWIIFLIFPKKAVIWCKILFFGENEKNPPFPSSSACVWTIITLPNLELLLQPPIKKHIKHSNFSLFEIFV